MRKCRIAMPINAVAELIALELAFEVTGVAVIKQASDCCTLASSKSQERVSMIESSKSQQILHLFPGYIHKLVCRDTKCQFIACSRHRLTAQHVAMMQAVVARIPHPPQLGPSPTVLASAGRAPGDHHHAVGRTSVVF